ncbi:MAG: TetR/AcrR family transcriptional regulator [Flavitalea sp.]
MNTREKILDRALKMFNERGIEYVGLRELASHLDIRVGNITYYFPTKDDLVYNLSLELSKKNAEVMVADQNITLQMFLEILRQMFYNQIAYRCLLLSFVHVMQQNKLVATAYKKTQKLRRTTISSNLEALITSGYLSFETEEEKEYLVSMVSLISRFWISEAAISFRDLSAEAQMKHYLKMVANTIKPFASLKGKKEIMKFVKGL